MAPFSEADVKTTGEQFVVYLAGEIHSDWRDEIKQKSNSAGPADYVCRPDGKP